MGVLNTLRRRRSAAVVGSTALVAGSLVALAVATAPTATAATPCGAASPTLTKLTLTPGSVNVKSKTKTIKVSGTTSGTKLTNVSITAMAVGSTKKTVYGSFKVGSGGHSFSGNLTIPKFTSKGTWRIDYLYLSTDVGGQYYDYAQLSGMANVKSSFSVVSNPDGKNPTISAISLSKTSVNTKNKVAKVTFTATAKDTGGAGLAGAYVSLQAGKKSLYGYATLKKGKLKGTVTVPKWIGNATYKVNSLTVYDKVSNSTTYRSGTGSALKELPKEFVKSLKKDGVTLSRGASSKKLPQKFKKSLKVISKKDTTKPKIGATSVTPGTAAVGAVAPVKLNASVKASDSQSGISYVAVELRNQDPAGWGNEYGYLSPRPVAPGRAPSSSAATRNPGPTTSS
ncbi:MAG: hypothetical protein HZY75_15690 [Nocardioidaceae bacterium]|nr:MAG: hypothetical protein HZY75_15690 [Nocardioidaceae bacterium]